MTKELIEKIKELAKTEGYVLDSKRASETIIFGEGKSNIIAKEYHLVSLEFKKEK